MSSRIHYKFVGKKYSIVFEENVMSVKHIKEKIMEKFNLKSKNDDLVLTNTETNEELTDESELVKKHTSLKVERIPRRKRPVVSKIYRVTKSDRKRTTSITVKKENKETSTDKSAIKVETPSKTSKEIPTKISIKIPTSDTSRELPTKDKTTEIPLNGKFKKIPEPLTCCLCLGLLENAVITCCGYPYCEACVDKHLTESDKCPIRNCATVLCKNVNVVPSENIRQSVQKYKSDPSSYAEIFKDILEDASNHENTTQKESSTNSSQKVENTIEVSDLKNVQTSPTVSLQQNTFLPANQTQFDYIKQLNAYYANRAYMGLQPPYQAPPVYKMFDNGLVVNTSVPPPNTGQNQFALQYPNRYNQNQNYSRNRENFSRSHNRDERFSRRRRYSPESTKHSDFKRGRPSGYDKSNSCKHSYASIETMREYRGGRYGRDVYRSQTRKSSNGSGSHSRSRVEHKDMCNVRSDRYYVSKQLYGRHHGQSYVRTDSRNRSRSRSRSRSRADMYDHHAQRSRFQKFDDAEKRPFNRERYRRNRRNSYNMRDYRDDSGYFKHDKQIKRERPYTNDENFDSSTGTKDRKNFYRNERMSPSRSRMPAPKRQRLMSTTNKFHKKEKYPTHGQIKNDKNIQITFKRNNRETKDESNRVVKRVIREKNTRVQERRRRSRDHRDVIKYSRRQRSRSSEKKSDELRKLKSVVVDNKKR